MTWLGFAAPAWIAGLAALAVPIAIHLLSRGRQRRQRVGSVRWLAPAETLRARQIRPSRWWLLAVRCLLLCAVVLALAEPRLAAPARSAAPAWVLVDPRIVAEREQLEPGNEDAYSALDRALAAGEPRWLTADLAPADLAAPPSLPGAVDAWSLLVAADARAPAAARFEVFALDRLQELHGARPAIERALAWHAMVDPRPNRWVERAAAVDAERLAVVVGASVGSETHFTRQVVVAGAPAGVAGGAEAGLEAERTAAGWRLAIEGAGDALLVPAEPPALAATLLVAPERRDDARYVAAALAAAAEAAARSLAVHRAGIEAAADAPAAELVFWLAPAPVAAPVLERLAGGGILVSDALDRFERCARLLWLGPAAPLRVDRCAALEKAEGAATVWSSADGRPLLVGERVGAGTWLRFASRWNPAWTDLVLSPRFPAWLLELVEQVAKPLPSTRRPDSDRRMAGAQANPARRVGTAGAEAGREWPLGPWLMLPAFVLAAGERWLAARSSR